jgi:hypothetical protein
MIPVAAVAVAPAKALVVIPAVTAAAPFMPGIAPVLFPFPLPPFIPHMTPLIPPGIAFMLKPRLPSRRSGAIRALRFIISHPVIIIMIMAVIWRMGTVGAVLGIGKQGTAGQAEKYRQNKRAGQRSGYGGCEMTHGVTLQRKSVDSVRKAFTATGYPLSIKGQEQKRPCGLTANRPASRLLFHWKEQNFRSMMAGRQSRRSEPGTMFFGGAVSINRPLADLRHEL